jgi:hypothetical protein
VHDKISSATLFWKVPFKNLLSAPSTGELSHKWFESFAGFYAYILPDFPLSLENPGN